MSRQNASANAAPQIQNSKGDGKAPAFMIPVFKMPLMLYRLGLGWLMGKRFVQITHVGRRSGKVYRSILAVLKFDQRTKEIYAVSAWKGSDWYSNIQARPALLVETGFVRYEPAQRTLSPEEIYATFMEFRRQHPIFGRMVCRIPGWNWNSTEAEFMELARSLRGVAFRPK
jgi:deazaflavin-dependent oxidoreductase (nitroreductase family)